MAKELKKLIVEELTERYADMERCVVVSLQGLSSEATVEVRNTLREHDITSEATVDGRNTLREHDITLSVVKNSLMAQALKQIGLEALIEVFDGPCAIATGAEDIVELAKILSETADKLKAVTLRGGWGEGQVLQAEDVRKFATIPSREVLIAQFLGAAQGPASGLVRAMSGVVRNFVGVLDAVAKKEEEGA